MPKLNRYNSAYHYETHDCRSVDILAQSILEASTEIKSRPRYKGPEEIRDDPSVRLLVDRIGLAVGFPRKMTPDEIAQAVAICHDKAA